MRVMVSLNLADIMSATRPRTSLPLRETVDGETGPVSADLEEFQLLEKSEHSEPFDRESGTVSTEV